MTPDMITDNLSRAQDKIKAMKAERDACRSLLKEGCNLMADEYDTLKASITMPDGTLSTNPLDRWAVEKVQAMDEWILRAGKAIKESEVTR